MTEMLCPKKKSLKLRYRSARHACEIDAIKEALSRSGVSRHSFSDRFADCGGLLFALTFHHLLNDLAGAEKRFLLALV
jgi:hypothetical protein